MEGLLWTGPTPSSLPDIWQRLSICVVGTWQEILWSSGGWSSGARESSAALLEWFDWTWFDLIWCDWFVMIRRWDDRLRGIDWFQNKSIIIVIKLTPYDQKFAEAQLFDWLEGTARYAGLLLAPVSEAFFWPSGKKSFLSCLCIF